MAEPAGHASSIPCCIAGGGPAGMMLGFLMARAGVRTVVLEKHADFLRDFRGDTVHPSTLRIMDELGLLDEFLQRPHQRLEVIGGWFGDQHVQLGDFRGLPARYAFIAMMPQWEFLDFIADEARKLPTFTLRTRANVTGLIEEAGRVVGVRGTSPDGDFEIRADLTVGCDGRHSTVRAGAGLAVEDLGAPIDVLWFRVAARSGRARQQPGADRARPLRRHHRPRRLLAMRVRDRQGRRRRAAPAADRGIPRPGRQGRAGAGRAHRRRRALVGRRQAAHRRRRSPDAVVEAGAALHRRRGARDVAGRRRRHQPGDPGRGRRGQPARGRSCAPGPSTRATSTRSGRVACGRPRRRRRRRSASRTTSSCRCSAAPTPSSRCRCRCVSSPRCRCCSACSRACSAWASAPSTFVRPRSEPRPLALAVIARRVRLACGLLDPSHASDLAQAPRRLRHHRSRRRRLPDRRHAAAGERPGAVAVERDLRLRPVGADDRVRRRSTATCASA